MNEGIKTYTDFITSFILYIHLCIIYVYLFKMQPTVMTSQYLDN